MYDRRPDPPFSVREGLERGGDLILDDAPEALRYGLREVLKVLGYSMPSNQRAVLCGALRVAPDHGNWSEYPNIDYEVDQLIRTEPWHRFFNALERIPQFLDGEDVDRYREEMNRLFAVEQIGYRFEGDRIVRIGAEEFHAAIQLAQNALGGDERFAEARKQFERGLDFRNARPADKANAIKEAVNSVEATLQIIYARPGVALPTLVSQNIPEAVPGGIKNLWKALYSQGSGTIGARHASIGGNVPTGPRADLALHVAAALHTFAVAELDTKP